MGRDKRSELTDDTQILENTTIKDGNTIVVVPDLRFITLIVKHPTEEKFDFTLDVKLSDTIANLKNIIEETQRKIATGNGHMRIREFPVIPAAEQILREEGCADELIENVCVAPYCNRRGPPGSCDRCEPETIEKSGIK